MGALLDFDINQHGSVMTIYSILPAVILPLPEYPLASVAPGQEGYLISGWVLSYGTACLVAEMENHG